MRCWSLAVALLLPLAACSPGNAGSGRRDPPTELEPVDADEDGSPVGPGGDCDDTDPSVHPGAFDVPYDGVDQDCSGVDLTDPDGDGHFGHEGGGADCDDFDPSSYPGAPDPCGDRRDQDCDGVDVRCEEVDDDRDGWSVADGDCRDDDPAIHPGVPEVPYDGIDQDCRNGDLVDVDHDGWPATAAGGADCDDGNAGVYPGAPELCGDGLDADCSGADRDCPPPPQDLDRDGHAAASAGGDDCDDTRADVNPDELEIPGDGVDQDCDGEDAFRAYPVEHTAVPPGTRAIAVFWNGDHYRLIWVGDHVYGSTPLDRSGRALADGEEIETFETTLAALRVVSDDDHVLVLAEEAVDDQWTRRVTVRPLDPAMVPGPAVELGSSPAGWLTLGPGETFLYGDDGAPPVRSLLDPTGNRIAELSAPALDRAPLGTARFPGGALISFRRDDGLWGVRIAPDGAALTGETWLGRLDVAGVRALVGGPDAHLLVADDGSFEAALLDPVTGAVRTRVLLTGAAYVHADLNGVAVGPSFFVVWEERRWPGFSGPVGQWIAPGGTPIGSPRGFNLPLASLADSLGSSPWSIATDGNDVLLWWWEAQWGWGPIGVMRIPNPGGAR